MTKRRSFARGNRVSPAFQGKLPERKPTQAGAKSPNDRIIARFTKGEVH
ncbi:hypothetical protein B4113_3326 [Geobacillus sp. B4113_201601]|nr:hypothetical protein B4113_3326 [Geobacillus sp. B4113_201601]